jgi:ABC-type multidrug transport system fused ATPase/permease subunit
MCFSATADFAGSVVLGAVGVATLREVKDRREVLLAAVPCLFAVHEFIEGFVWMGLDGMLPQWVAHNAGSAYVLYAQGLLPFLLPLSVFLTEPTKRQRRRMMAFVILGGVLALYLTWGLVAYPTAISMQAHSILYVNVITTTTLVAVLYVIATCGSLFFSGFRALVALGWANLIGLLVVMLVKRYAFTSVWCAYAAVVSVIIYFFFRRSGEHRLASYAMAAYSA